MYSISLIVFIISIIIFQCGLLKYSLYKKQQIIEEYSKGVVKLQTELEIERKYKQTPKYKSFSICTSKEVPKNWFLECMVVESKLGGW